MKCRETKYWLYSFRPNSSWPVEVVGHLQECPQCRHLQTQLKQLDEGVAKLTNPATNSPGKARLMELIDRTPQTAAVSNPLNWTKPWSKVAAFLVGSAALILVGWLLGRSTEPTERIRTVEIEVVREKPVEVIREKIVEVVREKVVPSPGVGERSLVASLVRNNARLVQSAHPADRLEALLDMADDCRQHALKLIEQGPHDALPAAVEMYTSVLRDGAMAQLNQAAPENRTAMQMIVRTRMEKMENIPAPATPLPVILERQRQALRSTARHMLDCIDHPEKMPAVRNPVQSEWLSPSAALVLFALVYGSDADPMVKADRCADYVKALTPTMMLVLADNGATDADMGQQFGDMIRWGVYRPLELATSNEPTPAMKTQAERIMKNATQSVQEMEKQLESVPKDRKVGLEKAVQASKKGKGWGKTKAK